MKLELIKNYIYPKSILDIGANKGRFHLLARQHFPEAKIFSIEANANCEPYLKNITSNYKIALLAKNENLYNFFTSKNDPTSTGNSIYKELTPFFSDDNLKNVKIQGVRLDDLFPEQNFDLVKLDTQGSELDIISGGVMLCKRAQAILMEVSILPYNQGAPLYDEVIYFMRNLGFENIMSLSDVRKSYVREGILVDVHQQDILFLNQVLS